MNYTKKMIGLWLVVMLNAGCSSNSQVIKIEETFGYSILKGPVKKMQLVTYELNKGTNLLKGKIYNGFDKVSGGGAEWAFGEDGTVINQISYKEGSTDSKYYFEYYYKNKKLIRRLDFDSPNKKNLIGRIEYEYDTKENITDKRFYEPSYCETNKLWLTSKYNLEYNRHNDVIKQIDSSFVHYDCDDIRIRAKVREYHQEYENGLKTVDDSYSYEYDTGGNLIKKIDKINSTIYYEYYPSGVRKKKHLGRRDYDEFNEDGYYKRRVVKLRSGDEYTFEYDGQDKYGNWTRMVIYEDGKPYLIGERTILYYE